VARSTSSLLRAYNVSPLKTRTLSAFSMHVASNDLICNIQGVINALGITSLFYKGEHDPDLASYRHEREVEVREGKKAR